MKSKIVAIYKPKGPTSHDIVYQVRRKTGIKKVGHGGTLDPLASGVLIIGIGREATKTLGTHMQKEKEYIASVRFGMTSTTDDKEGKKTVSLRGSPSGRPRQSRPHKSDIQKILPQFIGEIWQMPPQFSAIKRGGQKAYKLARAGKKVVLGKRQVLIKEIEILNYSWPYLKIRVVTGSGAYIRSLARDIGKKLKVGGYLANLERTRVGDYSIKDCVNINKL